MSRTVKIAKSTANTYPPSSLMAAHCMATVKEKFTLSGFGNLNLLLQFQLLKCCSVFQKFSDGLLNK